MSLPGSGSDAGSLVTRAALDTETDEYVINGGKAFISGAGSHAAAFFYQHIITNILYVHAYIHTYIHTCIWTGMSDLYLVMCREEEGISCLLVPLHAQVFTGQDICMYVCMYVYRFVNSSCMYEQGLSFGQPEKKMGWNCQPTRQITFDNVRVPRENRSGLRNCLPVEIAQNNLFWCF